ncbi:MAG: metallophosphoesterase [Pseudomonadales bacterium]|nr:metallophosphoesterase [Pseudomonadales bacterium]
MSQLQCSNPAVTGYDIIGDIHGCGRLLSALLNKLGYEQKDDCFRHAERKAIFLGDLIDRGDEIRDTVNIVRRMVENDAAHMVIGNHEYAAITFSTPAPESFDRPFLKKHTPRIKRMLGQTISQYHDYQEEWQSTVQWFRSLPLYLEFDNFRVVHACWDQQKIDDFDELDVGNSLGDDEFLTASVQPLTTPNRIIERLLKGTDMPLPDGLVIKGADGFTRSRFRTKFWKAAPKTYSDIVFQPDRIPNHLLKRKLSGDEKNRLIHYGEREKPLFVGHYWRKGPPRLIRDNIACLDYSAVSHGKLVAYRIDVDDKVLDQDRLVWVSA